MGTDPANNAGVREAVLQVIEDALRNREAQFGNFAGSDKPLAPWSGTPRAIIERIMREWEALGSEPTIGEIGWLERPRNERQSTD